MQICRAFSLLVLRHCCSASCVSTSSHLAYQCDDQFPFDRTNLESLVLVCHSNASLLEQSERFYSIIQSFTTINCTMNTLHLDRFTLWNYLESMSITHAHLTHLSSMIFNRSLSISPILYSIKTLNVSHNAIRVLNRNFSYYFPSLQTLDLSHNHLLAIRKKTFNNFLHLKELYLNNNHLKQILPDMFPRQSLRVINLHMNLWHCSCTNVLTLSISRPIPLCHTPREFRNQNVSRIARHCIVYAKANLILTTTGHAERNLTCALSATIDLWRNRTRENLTVVSAWHLDDHRPISLEHLSRWNNRSEPYLICFDVNSTHPESSYSVITLASLSPFTHPTDLEASTIGLTSVILRHEPHLSPSLLWLFKTSKLILPKYLQTSHKHILIVWLILLTVALLIFLSLIYYIQGHRHKHKKAIHSRSLIRFDASPSADHRTLFHVKFNCKNHKCLCQYRRRAHSTMNLTKSTSSALLEQQQQPSPSPIPAVQPSFIGPSQLRYAKIKRIASTKETEQDFSAGEFRTIVKLRSLPN